MRNLSSKKVGFLMSIFVFFHCNETVCVAQTSDWGIRVNGKEWYYERGEIFRGTQAECERKCSELNFRPSTSTIDINEVSQRIAEYNPGLGGSLPSQSMMNDFVNAVDEERKKGANVYTPERITSGNLNDNSSHGNLSVEEAWRIAGENADFNNDYVTTIIESDSRFVKDNNGFKGMPPQENKPRSRAVVLQERASCNCSALISNKEYEDLAIAYIRLRQQYSFYSKEKYSILCKNHNCNENEDDFRAFDKKLKTIINQLIDKMIVD